MPLSEAVPFEPPSRPDPIPEWAWVPAAVLLPWFEPVAKAGGAPLGADLTPAPALPSCPELVPVQVPQLEPPRRALAL